jgi:DNA-binding transcriptional LysR family regulator
METFELRYFSAVAATENVHRAAVQLAVSPGALSKAIARLESELGLKLFERAGRNIRLTAEGRILQQRAATILRLEEAARIELQGGRTSFQVRIAGPEILLAKAAPELTAAIRARNREARFVLVAATEADTERLVLTGEAQLGLTTGDPGREVEAKRLFDVRFQTCAGRGHPLHKAAKAGRTLPIAEVLEHGFVSPSQPILGATGRRQSVDGWRDDRFPRRVDYLADSLQVVQELVVQGLALAYLPDYYAEQLPVAALAISGCPYTCAQTAKLIARDPEQAGWLKQLF